MGSALGHCPPVSSGQSRPSGQEDPTGMARRSSCMLTKGPETLKVGSAKRLLRRKSNLKPERGRGPAAATGSCSAVKRARPPSLPVTQPAHPPAPPGAWAHLLLSGVLSTKCKKKSKKFRLKALALPSGWRRHLSPVSCTLTPRLHHSAGPALLHAPSPLEPRPALAPCILVPPTPTTFSLHPTSHPHTPARPFPESCCPGSDVHLLWPRSGSRGGDTDVKAGDHHDVGLAQVHMLLQGGCGTFQGHQVLG